MRWPSLIKGFAQSTPVSVTVDAEGVDEDGAPIEGATWSGTANWQDASGIVFTKDRVEVDVRATLYIDGDPFPAVPWITGGIVEAFDGVREIVRGSKGRNPDGTVNFTRLDLR